MINNNWQQQQPLWWVDGEECSARGWQTETWLRWPKKIKWVKGIAVWVVGWVFGFFWFLPVLVAIWQKRKCCQWRAMPHCSWLCETIHTLRNCYAKRLIYSMLPFFGCPGTQPLANYSCNDDIVAHNCIQADLHLCRMTGITKGNHVARK